MSAVRDLGYKPYTGPRLPASHNTWVLLRHSFAQVWSSVLVKLAVLLGWIPIAIMMGIYWFTVRANEMTNAAAAQMNRPELITPPPDPGAEIHQVLIVQMWALVVMTTLGGGAGVVSADASQRAFQFYFAKPVTDVQYLIGRVGALALWCFLILFASGFMFWFETVGLASEETRWETVGLILPLILDAALISFVVSACAVGVSAIAKKPATTISAWLLLFVVPHVIAWMVRQIGDFDWLYLLSLPGSLGVIGSGLFKESSELAVKWYHALPWIALVSGGALFLTRRKLAAAEVIS